MPTTELSALLSEIELREPRPEDAGAWAAFLVEEQRRTYGSQLPDGFGDRDLSKGSIRLLEGAFAEPGDAVRRIAWHGDRILGVAAATAGPAPWEVELGFLPAPAERELGRLYVHADAHGTGLGHVLFDAVVDERPHYLWLIDGNARASRFYERRGFRHLDEQVSTGPSWGHIPMHRMLRG